MAQRRRGRRGSHLLLGLVGVFGAMRLMAERMEVGFVGWKVHQLGLDPGALPRLRRTNFLGNLKQISCYYFQLTAVSSETF